MLRLWLTIFFVIGLVAGLVAIVWYLPKTRGDIRPKAAGTIHCPVFDKIPVTSVWTGEPDVITLLSDGPVNYRWVGVFTTDNYRQWGAQNGTLNKGGKISFNYPPPNQWGPPDRYGAHSAHVTLHLSGDWGNSCGEFNNYLGHNWGHWFHQPPTVSTTTPTTPAFTTPTQTITATPTGPTPTASPTPTVSPTPTENVGGTNSPTPTLTTTPTHTPTMAPTTSQPNIINQSPSFLPETGISPLPGLILILGTALTALGLFL